MEKQHIILSIDIGIKNLGWTIFASNQSFITNSKQDLKNISLTFNIFNITETCTGDKCIVNERCKAVHNFIKQIANKFIIDYVIIERQVPTNTKAMELMYSINTCALCYVENPENIVIFDPKLKFTLLKISYDTTNKAHKKRSIEMCRSLLINYAENKLEDFDKFSKQDDVADSFNQCFDWMSKESKINITLNDIRNHII